MNSYYMLSHMSIKPPSKTKEGLPKILYMCKLTNTLLPLSKFSQYFYISTSHN